MFDCYNKPGLKLAVNVKQTDRQCCTGDLVNLPCKASKVNTGQGEAKDCKVASFDFVCRIIQLLGQREFQQEEGAMHIPR